MAAQSRQTRANDETIFVELQKLLARHNYPLCYASLLTATAWGEFLRMNLPGVSHCECKIIIRAFVIAKLA